MKNYKKSLKTLVFSLGLAVMTLAANNLNAQNRGLFGRGETADTENSGGGMMRQGDPINDNDNGGLTNQTFQTPLGGGIAILLAAGLGYVALKKKEDEQ
ncbi:MAG: hypothetical protein J6P73_04870 [Bacteroidales bacterium]|nr:hypothetical protein [Bacteroidales bacterium]